MSRARSALGLFAGALLVLSSAAHSILGWKAISEQLEAAHVPVELATGLQMGWQYGGAAMLAFGLIVLTLFAKRWRGERIPTLPALLIGVVYLGFGGWAFVASNHDPFVLVFLVPGVLLMLAHERD